MTDTLGFPPPSVDTLEPQPLAPPVLPMPLAAPATAPAPAGLSAPVAPVAPQLSVPTLPPLPTLSLGSTPIAAPKIESPGPDAATPPARVAASVPLSVPVTTLESFASLTPVTPAPIPAPMPSPASMVEPGAAPLPTLAPATPRRRPTARQQHRAGSTIVKLLLVAAVLAAGWFAYSRVTADDTDGAAATDAGSNGGSTPLTPITDANGQVQMMPPTQAGLPPIQVLPNTEGLFLVEVGPVHVVLPSLPTQTGASDPSQPATAAVRFTASAPEGVMTAVVTLDTRPITADDRAAFCSAALTRVLEAEGATVTTDTVTSPDAPHIRVAQFTGRTGVGDFQCTFDDAYAVVLTGVGATAPMTTAWAAAISSLTFHG